MVNYSKHEEAKGYTNAVYSDDHGKTWHPSAPFPLDGSGESGLVELGDGTIYLNSRSHTRKGNRWVAYSDDSGETWRDLHQDDELFDGPPDVYGCKAGLLRLDRDDGDILLFSSPSPDLSERKNIRVWVSFDGGETWPLNRLIKRGPGNYTWMTQGRKGTPSEGFVYLLAGKDWMARFNLAWLLGAGEAEITLSKRRRYRFSDSDLFRSAENAVAFASAGPKLAAGTKGYRVGAGSGQGSVVTQRMILPSAKMNLSYHVPEGGKLSVWIMDDSNSRLRDSQALTGSYQIDKRIEWQDGAIDPWVGKTVYVQFMLEGGAEVFGFGFDDVPVTGDDTASIGPGDDDFVLPPRHDYLVVQNPPFVKSVQGVRPFDVEDGFMEKIRSGYGPGDADGEGHLLSHQFSLPGKQMKISCDVRSGSVAVSLFDAAGKLIKTSHPVGGGLVVRQPVTWPDGFKLDGYVSEPVSLRFDLSGRAGLFAIRFDELFWE